MQKNRGKISVIVLAGGKGKRMKSDISKQYLLLQGKPLLYYSLHTFEMHPGIDEIVLVAADGEEDYCQKEIVEKYSFSKVKQIVTGGKERYHSVANGLFALEDTKIVLIHDGARPFVTLEMIDRIIASMKVWDAVVVGMPVKDTIKVLDENGIVCETPRRETLWQIQTPQTFQYELVREAHEKLLEYECRISERGNLESGGSWKRVLVTDDASVVEQFTNIPVKIIEGTYQNIKITTPEDLLIAEHSEYFLNL